MAAKINPCSDPLLSCLAVLHTLLIIYFPATSSISFSLTLSLSSLCLLFLLRYGCTGKVDNDNEEESTEEEKGIEKLCAEVEQNDDSDRSFETFFVGWDVGAPLEVIYEDHHEEDEDTEEDEVIETGQIRDRYPSLSNYYPETETDCSSSDEESLLDVGDWDSRERIWFELEDKEGSLIEIPLNENQKKSPTSDVGLCIVSQFEEENWIEIDVSLA